MPFTSDMVGTKRSFLLTFKLIFGLLCITFHAFFSKQNNKTNNNNNNNSNFFINIFWKYDQSVDVLSSLIRIQGICKGYRQTTLAGDEMSVHIAMTENESSQRFLSIIFPSGFK